MATNTKYTYIDFANEAIALAKGEPIKDIKVFIEKAEALLATQESKKEYNAKNPKKATAKGASEETRTKANAIQSVLTAEPMTATEINKALNADYTALQVANAVKFIDGVQSTKVIRETVNAKGLKQQKEYTAYFKA